MAKIDDLLAEYRNFDECLLLEVRLRDYQSTLELHFNYVYDSDGNFRTNLDEIVPILLRLRLVQEVLIRNNLNATKLLEPERMDWGMNQIALIRLEDDKNLLAPYKNLPLEHHHIAVRWEDARRIDVIFVELEVGFLQA
jgi:hypothetical protein